ncbi:FkbM family methyltransferase [Crocosphaera sp.]|uniref:FkbM family methyltransferase n=1 Tax=Crocosphaera sp. TaxID=2729996 RepID=UPI00261C425E|nr:FkbM family methyltransferase [Crocosphaera sp.]MDJ0580372.1 FkbM family methyltransferase [Crocosphaera sp.]
MDITKALKAVLPTKIEEYLKDTNFYRNYREYRLKKCKSISQEGQDYWVINEVFFKKRKGYFLEIGSSDGIAINNTYLLEKCYQWTGICIEANPNYFKELKLNRNAICLNVCLDSQEGEVNFVFNNEKGGILDSYGWSEKMFSKSDIKKIKTTTLESILQKYKAPKIIDYLSIDVEGAETRILKNFPFEDYIFLALTIERPSDVLHNILIKNNYILVKIIPELDNFYIHESFKKNYKNNSNKHYRS